MKIILAPQYYKDSLSAAEVAAAMKLGVEKAVKNPTIIIEPISDGGDGFLDALRQLPGFIEKSSTVTDALKRKIKVPWGILGSTAVIELAQVCGLSLLGPNERTPLLTTTYGVGELIKEALHLGLRRFLIGIGGSSTNDAGTGMAKALGVHFYNHHRELPLGAGQLLHLTKIDVAGLDSRVKESEFIIACDVYNPLLGPEGASIVYAPQKGASPQTTLHLEKTLYHFAEIVKSQMGVDLTKVAGAGAAGGTGAGCKIFLNAQLKLGIDVVMELIDFDRHLKGADLVITGEGRIDRQTLYHKGPLGIAKRAKSKGVPTLAVVGSLGEGYEAVHEHGIEAIIPLSFPPTNGIIPHTSELIAKATEEGVRTFLLKKGKKEYP